MRVHRRVRRPSLTDSAKYADIILPDLTSAMEQLPTSCRASYADNMTYHHRSVPPVYRRRSSSAARVYAVLRRPGRPPGRGATRSPRDKTRDGLAARGFTTQCRRGRPRLEHAHLRGHGWSMGIYEEQCPEGEHVAFKAFRRRSRWPTRWRRPPARSRSTPQKPWPSYVADYWELARGSRLITPASHVRAPSFRGLRRPATGGVPAAAHRLPLQGAHCHSSYANNEVHPRGRTHHASLWINPAGRRRTQRWHQGRRHRCRVFNDRGTVEIEAKVTPAHHPGHREPSAQGMWHDADMAGDKVDHGGCINTLTAVHARRRWPRPTRQHTNIGADRQGLSAEVERRKRSWLSTVSISTGQRCTGCKTCVLACKDKNDLRQRPSTSATCCEYGGRLPWKQDADDGSWTHRHLHLPRVCRLQPLRHARSALGDVPRREPLAKDDEPPARCCADPGEVHRLRYLR